MTDEIPKQSKPDAVSNPYRIGDPVVDLAQGRSMVVLGAPDQTVAEWSDENNYDLEGNYANGKLGASPGECVVRCVYVSDIRSEPSKDYTFPASRVALIDAHHADDGRRIADRIIESFVTDLFETAIQNGAEGTLPSPADLNALFDTADGADSEVIDAAESVAKATHGKEEYLAADE